MIFFNEYLFFIFINQDKTLPCACVDCEQSCPKPAPLPPRPRPFTILGLDGYKVCMAVLFVVLSTLFLIGVLLYPNKSIDGKLYKPLLLCYVKMGYWFWPKLSLLFTCDICGIHLSNYIFLHTQMSLLTNHLIGCNYNFFLVFISVKNKSNGCHQHIAL